MILVVAMIAAIALTLRQRKDTVRQREGQVHVKAADRMSVVKLARRCPAAGRADADVEAEKKA